MTSQRAFEIIIAYGADARRWPDDERAGVLALAAGDPRLAAAIAEARAMDGLLAAWASDVAPGHVDASTIVEAPRLAPAGRRGFGWFGGGLAVAAAAVGIIVLAPIEGASVIRTTQIAPAVESATASGEAGGSDAEAFASVFTPTVDEDELI